MFDHYKAKLRHAGWTWLEHKNSWYHRAPRNKDRKFGRNDKRAARAEARREVEAQASGRADFKAYEIDADRE
jgi:hypothetical protein